MYKILFEFSIDIFYIKYVLVGLVDILKNRLNIKYLLELKLKTNVIQNLIRNFGKPGLNFLVKIKYWKEMYISLFINFNLEFSL